MAKKKNSHQSLRGFKERKAEEARGFEKLGRDPDYDFKGYEGVLDEAENDMREAIIGNDESSIPSELSRAFDFLKSRDGNED